MSEVGSLHQCPWDGFAPASVSFCENRLCAWIVEPANTWSNLAYLSVGIYLLWRCRPHIRDAITMVPLTTILVGIGSFLFHATGTRWGEVLDVGAMYLISGLFITFNLRRAYHWNSSSLIKLYGALASTSILYLIFSGNSGVILFAFQVFIAGVLEIHLFRKNRQSIHYRFLNRLIITFIISFTLWALDISGLLCDPDNHILNGHTLWHFLNSYCLYCFHRFHEQFLAEESRP